MTIKYRGINCPDYGNYSPMTTGTHNGVEYARQYNAIMDNAPLNPKERQFMLDCGLKARHNLSDRQLSWRDAIFQKYSAWCFND